MKKYLVVGGQYSDWYIRGYFDNEEDAEEYCTIKNIELSSFDSLYVVEIDLLKELKHNEKILKYFTATLSLKELSLKENGCDTYTGEYKKTVFSISETFWFSISGTFESQEQCNKALYDYYAEYLSYENEYGIEEAIKLLSTKIECKRKYLLNR